MRIFKICTVVVFSNLVISCNSNNNEIATSIQSNNNSISDSIKEVHHQVMDSAIVEGKIMYPSEYPPEGECKLFARMDAKTIFLTSSFVWPEGRFSVKMPLGTYDFFCTVQNTVMNSIDTGFYSNFVLTNFDSKSNDHKLIRLLVNDTKKRYEICVCDWFKPSK